MVHFIIPNEILVVVVLVFRDVYAFLSAADESVWISGDVQVWLDILVVLMELQSAYNTVYSIWALAALEKVWGENLGLVRKNWLDWSVGIVWKMARLFLVIQLGVGGWVLFHIDWALCEIDIWLLFGQRWWFLVKNILYEMVACWEFSSRQASLLVYAEL